MKEQLLGNANKMIIGNLDINSVRNNFEQLIERNCAEVYKHSCCN